MPLETVQVSILQDASSLIWMAAPWRWTVACSPVFTCTAGQAYCTIGSPLGPPFLRIEKALVQTAVTMRPLTPVNSLPLSPTETGQPNFICFVGGPDRFFFDMTFPATTDTWFLQVWYKYQAPIITNGNMSTGGLLVMDDEYFWVYNEAVLYYTYKYGDDQRAGGASVTANAEGTVSQIQYSGQLGVVMAALERMRKSEVLTWAFPEQNPNPIKGT